MDVTMMARAPIGSCANDPSQAKCPPARAIVYAGDGAEAEGWTSYGDAADAARTSSLFPQCAIKVSDNPDSPYKASGRAQMNAANQCYATVTRHELYGSLWKYYKSRWYHMNTTSTAGLGATTIRVHTTYRCTATPLRAWRARGEGYALLAGVFWAGYILTSARVGGAVPGQGGLTVALAVGSLALVPLGRGAERWAELDW